MKIKQQLQLHDARRYEAPAARTVECTTEGVLCMSVEVSTESYNVMDEQDW